MFRAVNKSLSVNVSPGHAASYGQVLSTKGIDLAIGKLWLTECETRHVERCVAHGTTIAVSKPTFLRLLDVDSLSIVVPQDPAACRYIALSYVWGSAKMIKLQHNNLRDLSAPGGIKKYLNLLPRTILDAMDVVKELGERYSWADSLCILQEGTDESHQQIASMDSIYGSSLLTIVDGEGNDAQSGLSGVQRRWFAVDQAHARQRSLNQKVAKVHNDISIIAPYASQHDIQSSAWNTRAWTFQERLLSRRLIIFYNDEVIWHCWSTIAREDMPVEESEYPVRPLQWLSLKAQYFGIGVDSGWKDGSFVMTRHGFTHVVRCGTFAEYAKMVAQYTVRKMTYESDAINAVADLLRIFSLCFQSECIFGLHASLFDVALLWRPLEPLERRDPALKFPSWSWTAWKGKMAYNKQVRVRHDESGDLLETEGIRPLLRYYTFEKHTGTLVPLNGTGRGLPLTDDHTPKEWETHPSVEGCQSIVHTCKTLEMFDLDPRMITEISGRHVFFWTSTSDGFELNTLSSQEPYQKVTL